MKKEIAKFLLLVLVALGAGPAGAKMWNWSTTASNNATADPSINFSEGMAPSSVNDSARALMAVVAAWRNDISMAGETAGTATAYTLTTSEGVANPPATGQMIAFRIHTSNTGAATLQVDGGAAYPLWLNGVAVTGGSLIAGTPYRVSYNPTSTRWDLESGYGNPYSVPLGSIMWSTVATPPNSSFVAPSGQCISTTTYAAYWVAMGSPASGGCPGGQFQILDMRGRTATALDTLNGSAANRLTGASTGCNAAFASVGALCSTSESFTIGVANLPPYTPTGTVAQTQLSYNNVANFSQTGATFGLTAIAASGLGTTFSLNSQSFTGGAQGGVSQAVSRIAPNIGLIPYLRIL